MFLFYTSIALDDLENSDVGNMRQELNEIIDSLENENNESFNFGFLNGVRGFFTNPSRADDCFIPFSSNEITLLVDGYLSTSDSKSYLTLNFDNKKPNDFEYLIMKFYWKDNSKVGRTIVVKSSDILTTKIFKLLIPLTLNSSADGGWAANFEITNSYIKTISYSGAWTNLSGVVLGSNDSNLEFLLNSYN